MTMIIKKKKDKKHANKLTKFKFLAKLLFHEKEFEEAKLDTSKT